MRQFGHVGGCGEVTQGGELDGVGLGSEAVDNVAEQAQLAEEPVALIGLEADVALVEARQNGITARQRSGEVRTPPDAVVKVDHDGDPEQASQS